MTRPYCGESAEEWLGITCPDDDAQPGLDIDDGRDDYNPALEQFWQREIVAAMEEECNGY
jgi:hypothetical protein